MAKKLIFLENLDHTLKYLKNIHKFKEFIPIIFDFKSEKILEKKGVKFLIEEDYEKDDLFYGIHTSSLKEIEKIINYFNLNYKDINLMELFTYNLYILLSSTKRNTIIFKEIIKRERPEKIIIFEGDSKSLLKEEFAFQILPELFRGEIIKIKYTLSKNNNNNNNNNNLMKEFFGKIQKLFNGRIWSLFNVKKSVLSSGGNQYFKGVLNFLGRKGYSIISVGAHFGISFFASKKYVPFYQIDHLDNKNKNEFLEKKIRGLISKLNYTNLNSKIGIEKSMEKRIKKFLEEIIKNEFFIISRKIDEIIYLIKKNNVKMTLVSDDFSTFGFALIKISKLFSIPSINFHHGFFIDSFAQNPSTDYVFVYGKESKKISLKAGISKENIYAIGCPRYDKFKYETKRNSKKIVYAMEISSGNYSLTPETQLSKKKQKEILRKIFRVMKKFPNYKLIIKTRKGWGLKGLPEKIAKEENFENFEVIEKTNNEKLLNDCLMVIVNHSTMGLEALLLKKPLISISYKSYDKINFYKRIRGVSVVYTQKQLEKAIIKNDSKKLGNILLYRKYLKDFLIFGKNSTNEAIKIINNILNMKLYSTRY